MITKMPELGSNERQLILNCARLELDDLLSQHTEEILHKPLEWDTVLFYAKLHSVSSLLYRNLKLFNKFDLVPSEARRTLLRLSHRTEYQNRLLSKVLYDLLEDFAEADIPIMVLKGITLVELIYGHPNLRPLIDINLLIPKEKVRAGKKLLLQNGYVVHPHDPSQGMLFSQLHLEKRADFEVHLLLQWHIVNWPRVQTIDMSRIWEEAQYARLAGCDTLILSPVDIVLYLCLQPDKHGFLNFPALHVEDPIEFLFMEWTNNRLIRFVDIYEVIRHYQNTLDWNLLTERARESGIQESVYASLDWVNKIMGRVVEPWVLAVLHTPSPRPTRKWIFEALNQQTNGDMSITTTKALFRAWWLEKPKLLQLHLIQLLNLFEFMFPSRDELILLYRLRPNKFTIVVCSFHAAKTFFLGLIPWIYRVFVKGKIAMIFSPKKLSEEILTRY